MSNLLERVEKAREVLKDKKPNIYIELELNKSELRHINMALRLWNYGDTILNEELDIE